MRYQGGKGRLAKLIAPEILSVADGRPIVELFHGGLAMTEALQPVRASDWSLPMTTLVAAMRAGWEPPAAISEDDYRLIAKRRDEHDDPLVAYVGQCCTFGGKWFGGYARGHKRQPDPIATARNTLIKRIKSTLNVQFSRANYSGIDVAAGEVVYCDPPYFETSQDYPTPNFDSAEFWDWARRTAKRGATVIVSEFAAPDDIPVLWERERPNFTRKANSKTSIERLYILEGNNMTLEQSGGSAQLRRFRTAIAAGRSLADAVEMAGAGFTIDEGRATLAEDAKRPPDAKATQTKDIDNMPPKKTAGKLVDPLGDLSKGLAADHALEKAKEAPAAKLDPAAIFKAPDPVKKAETALTSPAPKPSEMAAGLIHEPGTDGLDDERESEDTGFGKQLDKVVDQVLNAEFESGTLVGDMVDAMLVAIRQNPKGWSHMDEKQQRDTIRNLEKVSQKLLRKITIVVREGDSPSIHAKLVDYSAKDGFSIKLKSVADEATAIMLFKLQGHEVILTTVDTTANNGRRKEPEVDLDQAEISFADPAPKPAPKPLPTPPADDSDLAGEVEETKPDTSVEQDDAAAATLAPDANPLATDRIFNAMFSEWLAQDGATWSAEEEAAGVWEPEKADELAESLLSAEIPALHVYPVGTPPEAGDEPDFRIQPPKPEVEAAKPDAFEENAEEVAKRNAAVTGKEPEPDAADAWMKGIDD